MTPIFEESYLQDKHDRIVQELAEADTKKFWKDNYLLRLDMEIEMNRKPMPLPDYVKPEKKPFSWKWLDITP